MPNNLSPIWLQRVRINLCGTTRWHPYCPTVRRLRISNRNQTDVLYEEIFLRQKYLRHGIQIRGGDCI